MDPDRIENRTDFSAPVSRVWRALTDHNEFGAWFGARIEEPFAAGQEARGSVTTPGYEHVPWRAVIQDIEPEQYFAWTWHPFAIDPKVDYSEEVPTLVEFRLEPAGSGGTRFAIAESGFNDLPDERRAQAYAAHQQGWTQQMKNLGRWLEQQVG